MPSHLYITLVCLLITQGVPAQVDPAPVGSLPALLAESSGLQCPAPNTCYTFNDNADDSRVYRISHTGAFLGQTVLAAVSQVDYEDIAHSDDGRTFIGDFGNNDNDRQDLVIYISDDIGTSSLSMVESIVFSYEDQVDFPPSQANRNFDVEAMIHLDQSLYLFTRNRNMPFDGICKIYRLPDTAGTFTAELVTSFTTNLSQSYGIITGADISPSGNRIALLTSGSLFIWTNWATDFQTLSSTYNFFSEIRDYEGLSFIDDCTLLLTEESTNAQIYSINSCDIITSTTTHPQPHFEVIMNSNYLAIETDLAIEQLSLINMQGQIVAHTSKQYVSLDHLHSGAYIIEISGSWGQSRQKIYVGH